MVIPTSKCLQGKFPSVEWQETNKLRSLANPVLNREWRKPRTEPGVFSSKIPARHRFFRKITCLRPLLTSCKIKPSTLLKGVFLSEELLSSGYEMGWALSKSRQMWKNSLPLFPIREGCIL